MSDTATVPAPAFLNDFRGVVLAIDPGAGGAFAWVSNDGHLIEVEDMPMWDVRGKKRVSAQGVARLMDRRIVNRVVIEGVGSMPRQGVASAFTFGYAAGILEGAASSIGIPVQVVRAADWKRKASVPADKGAARQMASRMWPGASDKFSRVKDDGRAEAALMGRWAALGGV